VVVADPMAARQWLDRMALVSQIEPAAMSYAACLKVHSRAGDILGALEIVKAMVAQGVRLDVVSWTSLLSACANSERSDASDSIVGDATFQADFNDDLQTNLSPQTQVAREVFSTMIHCGVAPSRITLRELERASA